MKQISLSIRFFDCIISSLALVVLAVPLLILIALLLLESSRPLIFQERHGQNKKIFRIIKLRTMRVGTGSFSTHLVPDNAITPMGRRLRALKLDEIPQLANVLLGQMSIVGPRPNLPSQQSVIEERDRLEVYRWRPGITGRAQITGVDMSQPRKLADIDLNMMKNITLHSYLAIVIQSLGFVIARKTYGS